jgi:hypothetical protein
MDEAELERRRQITERARELADSERYQIPAGMRERVDPAEAEHEREMEERVAQECRRAFDSWTSREPIERGSSIPHAFGSRQGKQAGERWALRELGWINERYVSFRMRIKLSKLFLL